MKYQKDIFGGWYLTLDCSGNLITEVLIDSNNPIPNMVYAKWLKEEIPEGIETTSDPIVIDVVPNTSDEVYKYIINMIVSLCGIVVIKKVKN